MDEICFNQRMPVVVRSILRSEKKHADVCFFLNEVYELSG